ncbi:MAG: hypothetical protein ACYCSN_17600 [Acidobacteriaceae bacterium]
MTNEFHIALRSRADARGWYVVHQPSATLQAEKLHQAHTRDEQGERHAFGVVLQPAQQNAHRANAGAT